MTDTPSSPAPVPSEEELTRYAKLLLLIADAADESREGAADMSITPAATAALRRLSEYVGGALLKAREDAKRLEALDHYATQTKENLDSAELECEGLHQAFDESIKREDSLKTSLRWALEYLEDGMPNIVPVHACGFITRPDEGKCEFHEQWANAREAIGGWPESGGPETKDQ